MDLFIIAVTAPTQPPFITPSCIGCDVIASPQPPRILRTRLVRLFE